MSDEPRKPFDPSAETPEELREDEEWRREDRAHEAISMDTDTFMAVPAPTPSEPFEPPDLEEREGRLVVVARSLEPAEQPDEPYLY